MRTTHHGRLAGLTSYTRAKRIEIEGGTCALEILCDRDGHAKFVLHQRYLDRLGGHSWAPIHISGLYADADAAETDGLAQWKDLRKAWLGGMTVNERLFLTGLIDDWNDAVRIRDRKRMILILTAVELGHQATEIIEGALQHGSGIRG